MYLRNGKDLNHKIYSTITVRKYLPEGVKQIRVIGDPNNQRPDQLDSTVHVTVTIFRPCYVL